MPGVFVAFGVTGDLMRQKILPELFILHTKGELPEGFEIIGVSRKSWSDPQLQEYISSIVGQDEKFLSRFRFAQGDVNEHIVFEKLAEMIDTREAILYIALMPTLYKKTFAKLVASPLAQRAENLRLMIEKPFGTSGKEAGELSEILHSVFSESQLYRVDHYLAKESLANLPKIDTTTLKQIIISFLQTEGVEKRGAFFDATGAIRDLGQNHMMQMFAALFPTEPRAKVVGDLHILTPKEIATKTKHAQHAGYRNIPGVAPGSSTETYFKIETTWRGIPVIFEGGKYMQEDKKEIMLLVNDGSTQHFPIENNKIQHEHETLILACMRGDHTPFMSEGEVTAQWRFIDPIVEEWYH